jgi:arginase
LSIGSDKSVPCKTFPLDDSPDGQAADGEMALLLGLAGDNAPSALAKLLPALEATAVAMLGPRAADDERPTLDGRVFLRRDTDLSASELGDATNAALQLVGRKERPFWLHVDLDVLSLGAFPAHDFPEPGGLGWKDLEFVTGRALSGPGCIGWSVVIYNPQLDPDRSAARRVISYITTAAAALA